MLQIHILGLIAGKGGIDDENIVDFLNSTFLCHQIRYGTNEIDTKTFSYSGINSDNFRGAVKKSAARIGRKSSRGTDPLGLPEFDDTFKSAADLMDESDDDESEDEDLSRYKQKKTTSIRHDELKLTQPVLSEEEIKRSIQKILKESLEFLRVFKFIQRTPISSLGQSSFHYSATELGTITSQLYLKPMSAESLFRRLKLLQKIQTDGPATLIVNEMSLLYAISLTHEIQGVPFRTAEFDLMTSLYRKFKNHIEMFTFQFDTEENQRVFDDMDCLKQTFILNEWINETPEATITETYNIGSGDLSRCVDTAEWMARGIIRFAKLLDDKRLIGLANNLNKRIKYGIKAELLPLISLKGIGRVRARLLYKRGIISLKKIIDTADAELTKIPLISQNLVDSIKQQIRTGANLKAGMTLDDESVEGNEESKADEEEEGEIVEEEDEEEARKEISDGGSMEDLDTIDMSLDDVKSIPDIAEDTTEKKSKKSSKQTKLF